MGKTIRQLSEELKLSKQAINQRINSINGFRSKHTYKVKNHLEIDNQGVKLLANFDKQKRQERQQNQQDKNDKNENIDHILLKQLDVKDQQIANLQQALDQQQKLQIATVSENHRLKEHVRKLSGLLEPSSATQQQQSNDKDDALSNNANTRHSKDKNDKQNENRVAEYGNRQKKTFKNNTNNSWWHFW
ncbi:MULTISPECIES: DUF536 domain-containing protein [Lactobacillales]|uniref:DUF536 domain-containing protein n=1 Tax=Lactiplantibacillus pentosus TaxID=1589 RepID=A0AAW8WK48_LACPE|nr:MULTISPECIES: DUF536 domain-containing protein [Lactobacillales]MCE2140792.1 DUF536 domain-containing protein [Streptococcus thermophilus]MBT1145110.1 DUF536 domain-containing protein [Lactiplantibacillus argentoratensis]MBT1147949.1 DUF536 domain-containing protein [Lactiplantibacillus argentoratensis]MBT1147999.1 DUF536 domain-containing protein [Lactiplantibacillus argentoratensis]MBT1153920.1 DUF536 domain-containing protein [Lactiplantibacillus argentoratensis]